MLAALDREGAMPEAQINGTCIHYDLQGAGEPLVMIPFLTADHACFAFQLPAYADHFSCYAVDLRGSGATPRGEAECTMAQFVEDLAGVETKADNGHPAGRVAIWDKIERDHP